MLCWRGHMQGGFGPEGCGKYLFCQLNLRILSKSLNHQRFALNYIPSSKPDGLPREGDSLQLDYWTLFQVPSGT